MEKTDHIRKFLGVGESMPGIRKLTYSEQVVEYIKQALLDGRLSPGDQVKEGELSQELGISRAPVREALQTLARDGLIHSEPQKGKYVAALTSKQIQNSYFAGGVLEAAAVSEALPLYTDDDIARMEEYLEIMRQMAERNEVDESLRELDNAFHSVLFSRIDNDLIIDLCRRSCQGISKFLFYKYWLGLYTPQEIYERHKAILDAVKSRKPALVEKILRKHYTDSGKRMYKYGCDQLGEIKK